MPKHNIDKLPILLKKKKYISYLLNLNLQNIARRRGVVVSDFYCSQTICKYLLFLVFGITIIIGIIIFLYPHPSFRLYIPNPFLRVIKLFTIFNYNIVVVW